MCATLTQQLGQILAISGEFIEKAGRQNYAALGMRALWHNNNPFWKSTAQADILES